MIPAMVSVSRFRYSVTLSVVFCLLRARSSGALSGSVVSFRVWMRAIRAVVLLRCLVFNKALISLDIGDVNLC